MSLATIVDIVTAAALVFGVVFAAIQLRHLRDQRRVQSALELVHAERILEHESRVPAKPAFIEHARWRV